MARQISDGSRILIACPRLRHAVLAQRLAGTASVSAGAAHHSQMPSAMRLALTEYTDYLNSFQCCCPRSHSQRHRKRVPFWVIKIPEVF